MHTPVALEKRNQAVDRADGERIAADQQGMKTKHGAQPVILHVTRHQAIHAAIASQPRHFGHHTRHINPGPERHVAKLLKTDAEYRLARAHVAFVAIDVCHRQPRHFVAHRRRVAGIIERVAIVKPDTVKRRYRPKVDVVRHATAAKPPEFVEQERSGNDGGTRIEAKPVLAENTGPPPRGGKAFQHCHAISASTEADCRRQPAEPAADNDGGWARGRIASRREPPWFNRQGRHGQDTVR
jgi:hypothetical protein